MAPWVVKQTQLSGSSFPHKGPSEDSHFDNPDAIFRIKGVLLSDPKE